MPFRIDSRYPNKVIGELWNGCQVLLDATPELLSAARQAELEASSGVRLLRDNATLKDFQAAHPGEGVGPRFYQWCTKHQCTPRHTMNLELQARGQDVEVSASGPQQQQAMTFHPGMRSHTFHPPSTMAHTFRPGETMGDAPAADPLDRENVPLSDDDGPDRQPSDDDINSMTFPKGISLSALKKAGIVHENMTQTEFDARLKRVKVDLDDRVRLAASAFEAGYLALI
jgi:hypothetical protein